MVDRGEMSSVPVSESFDLILVGVSVPVPVSGSLDLILVGVTGVVGSGRSVLRVGVMGVWVDMCPVQVSESVVLIFVGVVKLDGLGGLMGVLWLGRVCIDVVEVVSAVLMCVDVVEVVSAVLLCEIEEPELAYMVSEELELVYEVSEEAVDDRGLVKLGVLSGEG